MNKQPRKLTLDEAIDAMIACRKNAAELIEEADLLRDNGRTARAFTLTHTACEELAKASMFATAAKRIAQQTGMNWKRFWERLRSHDSKISHIEVLLLIAKESGLSLEEGIAGSLDVLLPYGLRPRNSSIYVEFLADGSVAAPSDLDWSIPLPIFRALADFLSHLSRVSGSTREELRETLTSTPAHSEVKSAVETLHKFIEMCHDRGVPRERLEKILARAYQQG